MAATYIFKKLKDLDNHFDTTDVVIKLQTDDLTDLLTTFKEYLQACGYQINGDVIVSTNEE